MMTYPGPGGTRGLQSGGSVASSRASGRSTRSGYRVVSRQSEVDETLFGNAGIADKHGHAKRDSQVETLDKAPPGRSKLSSIRQAAGPKDDVPDAVVLTPADLERMRSACTITTSLEKEQRRAAQGEERERTRAAANERKARMIQMEEERKKRMPMTETERLKAEQDAKLLSRANSQLEAELDDVKRMNQMVLYSKCVTIRDAQIEEKKHKREVAEEEEQQLDLMMEVERLKALENYEERERKRKEELKYGAAVLKQQIAERELERQHQEELREQERQHIMRDIARMKAEEAELVERRKAQGRRLLAEVAKSNSEQIDRKRQMILAEKAEEEQIAEYLRQKEMRELAHAEEQERIRKARELETARLRSLQEKHLDKQAELDELRAMRAQEAVEREWRERERREAEKAREVNRELRAAREQQQMVKLKQYADQARMQEEEFYQILEAQQSRALAEEEAAVSAAAVRRKHKEEVLAQIATKEEQARLERRRYLEEGERMRAAAELEKRRLEAIKAQKLKELEAAGVPEKYRAELERKKISV
eukprot:jgi/Mesvir1/15089/Mv14730-RA.1